MRFVSTTRSHTSGSDRAVTQRRLMPALNTTVDTVPHRATTLVTMLTCRKTLQAGVAVEGHTRSRAVAKRQGKGAEETVTHTRKDEQADKQTSKAKHTWPKLRWSKYPLGTSESWSRRRARG